MRAPPLLLAALLALPLVRCSCQPPEVAPHPADPAGGQAIAGATEAGDTPSAAAAGTRAEAAAARAAGDAAHQAASTLHAYLGRIPAGDATALDAFWAGSGPGTPAEDAILRELQLPRGMRIDTGRPEPIDRQSPPRAFEVPVRLRVDTADGTRRIEGHYRLRARIDGNGWELTSAQLERRRD